MARRYSKNNANKGKIKNPNLIYSGAGVGNSVKIDLIIQNDSTVSTLSSRRVSRLSGSHKGTPGKLRNFPVIKGQRLFTSRRESPLERDGYFYGFVFEKSRSQPDAVYLVELLAYEFHVLQERRHLRLLQQEGERGPLDDRYEDFQPETGKLEDTGHALQSRTEEDNATLLRYCAERAANGPAKTKLFVLYDNVGKLTLQNIENMKLNLCIDMDTAGDYSYSMESSRQTYNPD